MSDIAVESSMQIVLLWINNIKVLLIIWRVAYLRISLAAYSSSKPIGTGMNLSWGMLVLPKYSGIRKTVVRDQRDYDTAQSWGLPSWLDWLGLKMPSDK